ncbi:hypothetical protein BCV72DRAFT_260217 [Rhizopus microsporus var. microsporus]|uniref:LysM domain-containing protein n=2 Tax=Rhizopus microsporus TaxID=58291 RepID=A0A2G4SPW5_RHIZD|nr:uncharacterized protein RHIMIDRAFT_293550 [Rhizopus microsporus ATCC 52813]ORE10402.1 hypothetical protein BCV72DRAFT_260217 [Rhizopus microsporus var. microsporus]PHZ10800.1 hypothetical protein RHIMIDRAFT_293550 [Rhizopus microsporus ATCC 52813]
MKLFVLAAAALSTLGLAQALNQPRCRTTYKAVNGDTCQSIASKHGITKDHLSEWTKKINASFDCDKVKPGDSICLNYEGPMEKRSVKKAPTKKHTTTKKPVHRKKHTTAKKPAHAKDKREVEESTGHKKKPVHLKKHTTKPVPPFKSHARD